MRDDLAIGTIDATEISIRISAGLLFEQGVSSPDSRRSAGMGRDLARRRRRGFGDIYG
jgi:hypothetical protein